jgi:hypothetical protein
VFLFYFSGEVLANNELTITAKVSDTSVTFSGYSSPYSLVNILHDNFVVGTTIADASGYFSQTLYSQTSGINLYSIYSEDIKGNLSTSVSLSISLPIQANTHLSNLILPPTIDPTVEIIEGKVRITGRGVPSASLALYLNEKAFYTLSSGSNGEYELLLNIEELEVGNHSLYVVTFYNNFESVASVYIFFQIREEDKKVLVPSFEEVRRIPSRIIQAPNVFDKITDFNISECEYGEISCVVQPVVRKGIILLNNWIFYIFTLLVILFPVFLILVMILLFGRKFRESKRG